VREQDLLNKQPMTCVVSATVRLCACYSFHMRFVNSFITRKTHKKLVANLM
jgi:hypothetical protein